jgi:hypothetical protein
MQDSYGDGWNGATLEVLVNNISIGNYSASNFGSAAFFSICNGDILELFYSAGIYENENTYQLQDSSWSIFFRMDLLLTLAAYSHLLVTVIYLFWQAFIHALQFQSTTSNALLLTIRVFRTLPLFQIVPG